MTIRRTVAVALVVLFVFSGAALAQEQNGGGQADNRFLVQALKDEVGQVIGMAFGFLPLLTAQSGGLVDHLTSIFSYLLAGGGGVCPYVSVNPPLSSLASIPSSITVTIDYGLFGCVAPDGSVVSGSIQAVVSNIGFSFSGISASYTITVNNLAKDGLLLGNGLVYGGMSLSQDFTGASVVYLSSIFNGFQISPYATLSGQVDLSAVGAIGLGGGGSLDQLAVTFTNVSIGVIPPMGGGFPPIAMPAILVNGTASTTRAAPGLETYFLAVDLATTAGPVAISAVVDSPLGNYFVISGSGVVINYGFNATNVVIDLNTCPTYPVGGTIGITRGYEAATIAFNPACDGSYSVF